MMQTTIRNLPQPLSAHRAEPFNIGSGDSIQTALSLQPIPPVGTKGTPYGVKAVITITDPVCVDYKWAGRWEPDFAPPDHEHAMRGVTHSPTTPTKK